MGNIFEGIMNFIYIPFGLIFRLLYSLVNNYGIAILLFAVLSKVCMLPLSIKTEKSRIRMQAIQPKAEELKKKYKGDTTNPKYTEEMQKLYAANGTSMTGGCGWQFLQFPIIWAIWNAIRNPITYLWDISSNERILSIATRLFNNGVDLGVTVKSGSTVANTLSSWIGSHQISLMSLIESNREMVSDLLPSNCPNINIRFLGLDLGVLPSWTSWTLLIPVISGVTSFLVGFLSQRLMTKKNKTASVDGATRNSMNLLLYIMPVVSVVIGFSFNVAIGLYWILSNLLSIAQTYFVHWYVDRKEEKLEAERALQKKNRNKKKKNHTQTEDSSSGT